jgi:hypothetical protein
VEGGPQGADADLQPQVLPQFFEGAVGLLGDGGPERRPVADVERLPLGGVAAWGDLASLAEAFEEDPDPLGGDGVLAGDGGVGHPGLAVGQHAVAEVQGERGHEVTPVSGLPKCRKTPRQAQGTN